MKTVEEAGCRCESKRLPRPRQLPKLMMISSLVVPHVLVCEIDEVRAVRSRTPRRDDWACKGIRFIQGPTLSVVTVLPLPIQFEY